MYKRIIMAKVELSREKIQEITNKGRKCGPGTNDGYYYKYEGKTYFIPKKLAVFNVQNPMIKQTKNFIDKRNKSIAANETLIGDNNTLLKKVKAEYNEFLKSCGVSIGNEKNLNRSQKAKASVFTNSISKLMSIINRAKMDIRGDLLSNFMDYCSIMKMH